LVTRTAVEANKLTYRRVCLW